MLFSFCCQLLLFILGYTLVIGDEHSFNGTVYYNFSSNELYIELGVIDCENGVACGYFNDSINITGWGIVEIKIDSNSPVNKKLDDTIKMYAAGMLEGYISSYEIYYAYIVGWEGNKAAMDPYKNEFIQWFSNQSTWINNQLKLNSNGSLYWQYVNLLQQQYEGQIYGYNLAAQAYNLPILGDFEFQFISGSQDMSDLLNIFNTTQKSWFNMTKTEFHDLIVKKGRCSAIIKVTPLLDDIYFSHTTWSEYFWMNRAYKHYIFDLTSDIPNKHLAMSSYPGCLASVDDFYILDTGLAVTETTNNIFNNELWEALTPESLFSWQRSRIANALATTGQEWVELFSRYNSGTYNNQWMVLDYKRFKPQQPLVDGLLWIAEQIPGKVSSLDVTDVLERGYWGSYNVPALEDIYNISGYPEIVKLFGVEQSYDLAPRARIFRRDATRSSNLTSIQHLMRYNDYKNDPIERHDPSWAVCMRGDLSVINPIATGCVDTKVSNFEMLNQLISLAEAGPTHDDLEPFAWTKEFENVPHEGLPYIYNFSFIEMMSILA